MKKKKKKYILNVVLKTEVPVALRKRINTPILYGTFLFLVFLSFYKGHQKKKKKHTAEQ